MGGICRQCGEHLNQHKDGQCDPAARKRWSRQQQNAFCAAAPQASAMRSGRSARYCATWQTVERD